MMTKEMKHGKRKGSEVKGEKTKITKKENKGNKVKSRKERK